MHMFQSNPLALTRFASSFNAILGAWIVLSPWIGGLSIARSGSTWVQVVTGISIGLLGTARYLWPNEGIALSWANLFLGGWLALLPWTLQFLERPAASWNCVIAGLSVMMFAGWSMAGTRAYLIQDDA